MLLNLASLFSAADCSRSISVIPNRYGRLAELNLMPVKGVMTRTILIEERNGTLTLLPTDAMAGNGNQAPASAPGTVGKEQKRKIRSFIIPRIQHEDVIRPEDVEAVRAFGGNEMLGLTTLVNDRLATMRAKHEITHEWLRWGALKGSILDADGSTEIYNLYTEFGITEKEVDFVLGTADTDVRGKCMEVCRHIEDNLLGDVMTRVHAMVSAEFFDKLTKHATVKAAFANYQKAQDMLGGDVRKGFEFGGILFEEHRGNATGSDGNNKRFLASGTGRAFPLATMETFQTFAGPADFNETVNTVGQVYYAKIVEAKFGRGYDAMSQSNVLPLNMRPAVSVKLSTSN